jgi:excisionase family DNA binding protein
MNVFRQEISTMSRFLTVDETAALLKRKPATVRAWLFRDETFPRLKAGRGVLIPLDQLEAWLQKQQPNARPVRLVV